MAEILVTKAPVLSDQRILAEIRSRYSDEAILSALDDMVKAVRRWAKSFPKAREISRGVASKDGLPTWDEMRVPLHKSRRAL
jgi:hypothetical protein